MNLRVRLSIASFVLFGVALAIAAWFVLAQHRESALAALDDGLFARLDDLVALDEQDRVPDGLGVSEAEDNLAIVLWPDGRIRSTTDRFGDPSEVLDQVDADVEPVTISLSTFAETRGTARMRVLVARGPVGQVGIVGQSVDSVDRSVADLRTTLLIVGPVLALIAAAVAGEIVGRALAPVEAMRREAAEISLSHLDRRVPEQGTDELAALGRTLNHMLERLERSAAQQQQLVADVAHELRSPLAAITTQLDVGLTHPDRVDWVLTAEETLEEAYRLQQLIDNLLLLARLDEGEEELTWELVDLDDVVHAVVRRTETDDVVIDRSEVGAGIVKGDRHQLRRCVQNLLDNAVRHAASVVRVSLREVGAEVVLQIVDDGPGIPVEEREQVFERFHRRSAARDRETGGTGLGLAIVRELISLHRGAVVVRAADTGGAEVEIRLPAAEQLS